MRPCTECGQSACGRMIEPDGSVRPIRDTSYRHPAKFDIRGLEIAAIHFDEMPRSAIDWSDNSLAKVAGHITPTTIPEYLTSEAWTVKQEADGWNG